MFRHPLRRQSAVTPVRSSLPRNHPIPLVLRLLVKDRNASPTTGEFVRDTKLASVEAALFLADEPLPARKLATLVGLKDVAEARQEISRLQDLYVQEGSAFVVEELAGGYQLLSRPEFHPWLARLRKNAPDTQLSPAARETLTVVAYRQPVTRADIDAIRGVGSNDVLKQLMEKGLVKLAGRDDSLGRPVLYETTKKFLQMFGLRSLKDLPTQEGL